MTPPEASWCHQLVHHERNYSRRRLQGNFVGVSDENQAMAEHDVRDENYGDVAPLRQIQNFNV